MMTKLIDSPAFWVVAYLAALLAVSYIDGPWERCVADLQAVDYTRAEAVAQYEDYGPFR